MRGAGKPQRARLGYLQRGGLAGASEHPESASAARARHLVFGTSEHHRQNPSNVRNRVLAAAVEVANERLEDDGEAPLPQQLTPHTLRHTFA